MAVVLAFVISFATAAVRTHRECAQVRRGRSRTRARRDSIVPDEVLAHRLGLIPILADPRKFEFRKVTDSASDADARLLHPLTLSMHSQTRTTQRTRIRLSCS